MTFFVPQMKVVFSVRAIFKAISNEHNESSAPKINKPYREPLIPKAGETLAFAKPFLAQKKHFVL